MLEQAEAAAPRRTAANYGPIVFSLQDRSSSWVVVPYALPARHFTPEQLAERTGCIAHAIDVGGLWTIRISAQPPLALLRVFLSRPWPRGMRHRARFVCARGCAGAALGSLADCGGGTVATVDGAHRVDDGGWRRDHARIASPGLSQLCGRLLRQ